MPSTPASTGPRVLVADDDADTISIWATILERAGVEVLAVSEPDEVLEAARAFAPTIALVDINLGPLDGHEVGASLRRLFPGLRIAAVTGDERLVTDDRSGEHGFDAHLVKPLDATHLLRVGQVLSKRGPPQPSE
jgi:CheY-like chemotaxis protein